MSAVSEAGTGAVEAGVGVDSEAGAGGVEEPSAAGTFGGATGVGVGGGSGVGTEVGVTAGGGALVPAADRTLGDATGVAATALGDFTGRACFAGDFRPFAGFFAGTLDRRCALFLGCGFGAARFAAVFFAGVRPLAAFAFFGAVFFGAGRLGDFLAMFGYG